jgi:CheY-like chemotaxis protein
MLHNPHKRTILYVEDNYLIQLPMISLLFEEGFEVFVADNGTQALDFVFNENLSIDALLADVDIGEGVNGWEVARCARLQAPTIPVVYTSSVREEEWMANAVPFSRLCSKPFTPSDVIAVLSSLMGSQQVEAKIAPILVCLPKLAGFDASAIGSCPDRPL